MFSEKTLSVLLTICIVIAVLGLEPSSDVMAVSNDRIIVSLGDSYSSGEGVGSYYGSEKNLRNKKTQEPDWLAHRSQNAWSGMLKLDGIKMSEHRFIKDNYDANWYFVAASGAKIENMEGNQYISYSGAGVSSGSYPLEPQLSIFDKLSSKNKKADYVTITIGGNDVGFSSIVIKACTTSSHLQPNLLADILTKKVNNASNLYGAFSINLRGCYSTICEKAGSQATLIVAGYPKLFNTDGVYYDSILLSKKEAQTINASVSVFNNIIQENVEKCKKQGDNIEFVSVETKFGDHGAYSDEVGIKTYINKIKIIDYINDVDVIGLPVSSESIHPNIDGAKAYAECVQAKINELEKKRTNASKKKADNSNSSTVQAKKDSNIADNSGSNIKSWKEEYKSIVQEYDDYNITEFVLADVMGDGVPELFIYARNGEDYIYDFDDPTRVYYGCAYMEGQIVNLPFVMLGVTGEEDYQYYNGNFIIDIEYGQGFTDKQGISVFKVTSDKVILVAAYYLEAQTAMELIDYSDLRSINYYYEYYSEYDYNYAKPSSDDFDFDIDSDGNYTTVKEALSKYGFNLDVSLAYLGEYDGAMYTYSIMEDEKTKLIGLDNNNLFYSKDDVLNAISKY